jgi:outer membrane usher protein
VGLQGGTIRSLDDPQAEPALLFSNRVGRIAVDGLRPGRYVIEFLAAPGQQIEVIIPESASGQYDAGNLLMASRPVVAQR